MERNNNCENTLKKSKYCEYYRSNCFVLAPTGPAGGVLNFADFYALMPPDNAATVAPGTDVSFPQDGPNTGFCTSCHYTNTIIFYWYKISDRFTT